MGFLNILELLFKYLENEPPAENSIISRVIQEPCSDRLILKEGSETSPISLITNKVSTLYVPRRRQLLGGCDTCLVGGKALYHEDSPLRNTYGNA